jgi:hypothetical protein
MAGLAEDLAQDPEVFQMSQQEKRVAANLRILAEMKELAGAPPVLSSESVEAYDKMMLRFIECFMPRVHGANAHQALNGQHLGDEPLHPPQTHADGTQVQATA